jgi:ABC-type amino acid transport substrate-binding protein
MDRGGEVSRMVDLVESGILLVGVDASSPGALHSDPSAMPFEGFEVDLMTDLAARLGLVYRYRSGLWAGLIDDLREGKLDAIVTAATITERRKQLVDFSQPYFDYSLAIATRRASAIRTLADLEGRRLAVRVSTTAEEFARGMARAAEILGYHSNDEACEAVCAGVTDAWIDDSPIIQWFVARVPELDLGESIAGTESQYAIMTRKGNDALRESLDRVLTAAKADGTFDRLYARWFPSEATRGRGM